MSEYTITEKYAGMGEILKKWGFLLIGLNLFDGLSTYAGMKLSLIGENNPLLSWMGPEGIVGVKMLLSLLLLFVLVRVNIKKPIFKYSLVIANCVYSFVAAVHLYWFTLLISAV
ncbi:hypothetical protein D1B31_08070 [Neobacillus notoginsengisoli]|uniref:DUF5658 domain-containing protein n=1 Tax=Neobacillus notoginsengisoli TaxID=1578198 RepID=A0A417YWN2_9BACI|nr:DUF5658 family protein [Neobacillus notoginsengisoli]RHW41661.1 hypothetical protein D1B31_08070 [Neobacillus notoginsengisoli]